MKVPYKYKEDENEYGNDAPPNFQDFAVTFLFLPKGANENNSFPRMRIKPKTVAFAVRRRAAVPRYYLYLSTLLVFTFILDKIINIKSIITSALD